MTSKQKKELIAVAIVFAILLYLLLRKKATPVQAAAPVQTGFSRQLDTTTGFEVGFSGVRNDPNTIGPVVTPIGVSNNINDANFLNLIANGGSSDIPLCPNGYRPLIDPENSDVYCTLNGYGNAAQHAQQQQNPAPNPTSNTVVTGLAVTPVDELIAAGLLN
jgi:hypothetical protein